MKPVLSGTANDAADESSVVMLGGFCMPAAAQEAEGAPRDERTQRAISLLEEALQIIDSLGDHPELGARLHDLIDTLKAERPT